MDKNPDNHLRPSRRSASFRSKAEVFLTAIYLAVGTLVFVFSEPYISAWLDDRPMPTRLERFSRDFAAKGVAFVLSSGLVLLLVLRHGHLSARTPGRLSPQSSDRMALVARVTTDAMWELDLTSNHVWRSDGYAPLFGYEASELEPSLEGWLKRLHAEDQDRVVSRLRQIIRSGAESWRDVYRFCRKDGSYAVVDDRAWVLRDAVGSAVRLVGGLTSRQPPPLPTLASAPESS